MTALVDLQAVVWYVHDDRRLGQNAREALATGAGELLMSSASLWELAIKVSLRKFALDRSINEYVDRFIKGLHMRIVDVTRSHALRVATLPHLHKDPFDRLLIAQAMEEGVPIITGDGAIARYGVEVIW